MAGKRLARNATSCKSVTPSSITAPTTGRVAVLIRSATTIPSVDATPTRIVIAISVTVYVPVTIRAQPSRNIQIAIISNSQNTKHDTAVHLASSERLVPSTIAIHSGAVWTT